MTRGRAAGGARDLAVRHSSRAPLAVAVAVWFVATLASGAGPVVAAGPAPATTLSVVKTGPVIDDGYPRIEVPLSVVDAATGRPEDLSAAGLEIQEATGAASPIGFTRTTAAVPGAYILLIDCSTSMERNRLATGRTAFDEAKDAAMSFIDGLGPQDRVKVVSFPEPRRAVRERTEWLSPSTSLVRSRIEELTTVEGDTTISQAIRQGTKLATDREDRFARYGVVLLTDADVDSADRNLTLEQMKRDLRSPVFSLSIGSEGRDGGLASLLRDVAGYTGGLYRHGAAAEVGDAFAEIRRTMRTIWLAAFESPGAPDGKVQDATLTVRAAEGVDGRQPAAGETTLSFRAGELSDVTGVVVGGLEDAEIAADRTMTVSWTGGDGVWTSRKLELFVDCSADSCTATEISRDAPLEHLLVARSLDQGDHTYEVRLTVTDARGNDYSTTTRGTFTRRGTTYNLEFVALVLGLGLVLTGIVAAAAMRKSRRLRTAAAGA